MPSQRKPVFSWNVTVPDSQFQAEQEVIPALSSAVEGVRGDVQIYSTGDVYEVTLPTSVGRAEEVERQLAAAGIEAQVRLLRPGEQETKTYKIFDPK